MSITRFVAAAILAACLVVPRHSPCAEESKKVVIPFDFLSKFDQGRYGEMLGDQIWKKLERQGGFVIPESMFDVRDTCKANGVHPSPEMPLEKIKEIVRHDFAAQIGIWGSIERAPGHNAEVYDLVILCVDFSAPDEPKVIYQVKARTNAVAEIPNLYVKQMLDALYGRTPGTAPAVDLQAEERWKNGANLIAGGDFETAVGGVPKGWEAVGGQQREPLGNLVRWLPEAGNPSNHVIRLTFDKNVGDNEGVMYYSRPFSVQAGGKYRFQCRWRSNGPAVKVFIKYYDEIGSQYRREPPARTPAAAAASEGNGGSLNSPRGAEMREVYRSQQNLKGPQDTWNTHTEDFTPQHTQYRPQWGRVMLYGYKGAGVVEFDDVVLKQIAPPATSQPDSPRRHSLETKVTIKEMEENDRRSQELQQKKKPPKGVDAP